MHPKYQRIAQELELNIRSGQLRDRLPTEAQLCARYGCSRQTIRSALALLEHQGMILRRQGSGAYVSPAAGDSRRIVLLLPDREEYTAPAQLQEAREAARQAGFTLTCLETGDDPAREAEHLSRLLRRPPGGIVLQPITDVLGTGNGPLLAQIREARIPLVYLNGRYDTHSPAVVTEDAPGAGLLATHLAAAGHRSIAAILKWDESRGLARYRGLLEGARERASPSGRKIACGIPRQSGPGCWQGTMPCSTGSAGKSGGTAPLRCASTTRLPTASGGCCKPGGSPSAW